MRRWLTLVLLVLLPLQSVWAAAATCCAYEWSIASKHFDRHEHHHGATAKAEGAKGERSKALTSGDDLDCASCHLQCVQPLISPSPVPIAAERERWTPVPPPWRETVVMPDIERPKWNHAVRFGEPLRFIPT